MVSADSSQIRGLVTLYRPPDEQVKIDIVAVHGLNGDAIQTWTSQKDICWLNHPEFLPKYVQCARVLTWGYNANLWSLKGRATSSNQILHHAQSLVAHLEADRDLEGGNDRPIIFICHSLGGIIVKRALAYSESRKGPKDSHLHSIFTCTYGVLFFGTPHHGAPKASLLASFQKLLSFTIPKAGLQLESSLVNALEEDSETLLNITDQFGPLMINFRIFFFWEEERTSLKYTKEYIVERESAAPMLPDTERCGIAADHTSMCRFDKSDAQAFRTVMAALKRYCREAPEVIRPRFARSALSMKEKQYNDAKEVLECKLTLASQGFNAANSGLIQGFQPRVQSTTGDSNKEEQTGSDQLYLADNLHDIRALYLRGGRA